MPQGSHRSDVVTSSREPDCLWFLGIALGALLPSLWAWLAIVRTEQTEGMVAARLLDSNLELVERAQGRGDLDAALWLQHRPALAKVLDRDAWEVVSRIYRDGDIKAASLTHVCM
jgi:hypothetical protein